MQSAVDECWKIAGECGRWAAESQDEATRLAFRQMATAWAQLAYSQHFTKPNDNEAASQPASSEGAGVGVGVGVGSRDANAPAKESPAPSQPPASE
jgi:hypothetical protein